LAGALGLHEEGCTLFLKRFFIVGLGIRPCPLPMAGFRMRRCSLPLAGFRRALRSSRCNVSTGAGSASVENREEHTADDVETGRVSMPP